MPSKLDALHARYYEKLLPMAVKLCRGTDGLEPKDLIQEALVRFLEHPRGASGELEGEGAESWLIATMTRYFIDLIRKARSRREAESDPTLTEHSLGQERIPHTFERIQEAQFEKAIAQLPEQQRLTFLMKAQGVPNPEIARRLGITVGVVRKRLFDARQNLRKHLQPYVDEGIH